MLTTPTLSDPADWGREALDMIRRDYYLPKTKLYSERPDKKQPAFNWGVGVMLSALNAASKYDPKYRPWLREYADASRVYWNKGGYDVLPTPKPLDRYYDDNAWMALALIETYEVLGDKKYLEWAKGALDFALEGEAKDGGIYWRESDKASRNTCSTAPTAVACFRLGERLGAGRGLRLPSQPRGVQYCTAGERLEIWLRRNLLDKDNLPWDSLDNNGKFDHTKWSYNAAFAALAAHELNLWRCTKDFTAGKIGAAAYARWVKDGKIDDPGRFAHLLLEAFMVMGWTRPQFLDILLAVHGSRSVLGHYPSHWGELKVAENPEILDQASFARACFVLANAAKS